MIISLKKIQFIRFNVRVNSAQEIAGSSFAKFAVTGAQRMVAFFEKDPIGCRACYGEQANYAVKPVDAE